MFIDEQPAKTKTPWPDQDYLRCAPGSSDVGKKLVMSEAIGITKQWKTIEQELSFTDESVTENASSKPKEKNSEIEVAKVYPPSSSKFPFISVGLLFCLICMLKFQCILG